MQFLQLHRRERPQQHAELLSDGHEAAEKERKGY